MFSYRHAFHAGNHADVLKHVVLVQLLRHLGSKDTPFWVIDTHAGAGVYALDGDWAAKRAEYADGIGRVWGRTDAPAAVLDYLTAVRAMNEGDDRDVGAHDGPAPRLYPGSPMIALGLMRDDDRLRLFEAHPNESTVLAQNIEAAGRDARRRTVVAPTDGFSGLRRWLPPPPRRALVLIDPSYEDKTVYTRVVVTLRDALTRFATGCYAIWYPAVQRREPAELVRAVTGLPALRWLHARLDVCAPSPDGLGLHGSGMIVVNPPWTLEASLRESLPWLTTVLGQDAAAAWRLQTGGLS